MRRKVLASVWFAVCGAVILAAQAAPPSPNSVPPADSPKAHSHAKARHAAPPVSPAIFDATGIGSPVILDKNWRVGITSDLSASSPAYNDSAWAIRDALPSIGDVPDEDAIAPVPAKKANAESPAVPAPVAPARRYAWFRLHIQLAPHHGPVALLIELPVAHMNAIELTSPGLSPEVFVDGKLIQPEGPHGDEPQNFLPISRLYNLNFDPSETALTVVVRVIYSAFGRDAYTGFFANHTVYLGDQTDLQKELNLCSDRSLFERLPESDLLHPPGRARGLSLRTLFF